MPLLSPVYILLISSVGWGLTWLPLKHLASQGMEGIYLVFIAFGCAAVLLLPFTLRQWSKWKQHFHILLLITFLGGFANITFQTALFHGDVIRVMILFYLLPAWSVIGGKVFLGEQVDAKRMFTVICALTGAFLILGGPNIFHTPPSWIDLLAIASGLSFAMNNIVFRFAEPQPLTGKVNAMFLGCAVMALIYILVSFPTAPSITTDNLVGSLLYGGIMIMLITFGTQWGVEQLEAGRASIIIITELVVAVISAAVLLNEQLNGIELIGGGLVILAAMVETFRTQPEASPATGET